MVKALLVTTGYNAVRDTLTAMKNIDLYVEDMNNHQSDTKECFLTYLQDILHRLDVQLLITWRCHYILPLEIYTIPVYGAFNIHPSLLPEYSGLNPWDEIYKNGETISGVTLHRITDAIDSGEIIMQKEISLLNIDYEEARKISDNTAATIIKEWIQFINNTYS